MTSNQKWLAILGIWLAMVPVAILFLDRPVALFIHEHQLASYRIFYWLQVMPEVVVTASLPLLLGCVYLALRRQFGRRARMMAAFVTGTVLALAGKSTLKWVFGRTWPETWVDNNPSLISNGIIEFHFFRGGEGFAAFPSGHATVIFMAATLVWVFFPRLRIAATLVALATGVGLLGMNYHFVGDILAGALVGMFAAWSAARLWKIHQHLEPVPVDK